MKTLKESIKINVPPEVIWKWILNFAENYCEWHPSHIKACWVKGKPNQIGSILYFEEDLEQDLVKFSSELTKLEPNKLYEFRTLGSMKFLMPRSTFEIEPSGNDSIFTATLDFRMGKLLSKVAKKSMNNIIKHMQEEGDNLKKILES
jgi:carbon monoxide dehydrogenase subunit G